MSLINSITQHPWTNRIILPIGGCRYIGFDKSTDLLLVCSTAGRGVIDCTNGKIITRDRSEYEPDSLSRAVGIGHLENTMINVMSIYHQNEVNSNFEYIFSLNKWCVIKDSRNSVFLIPPNSNSRDNPICLWSNKDGSTPLTAYAISCSENYIAVASSSEIYLYAKDKSIELSSPYEHNKNIHPKVKFIAPTLK